MFNINLLKYKYQSIIKKMIQSKIALLTLVSLISAKLTIMSPASLANQFKSNSHTLIIARRHNPSIVRQLRIHPLRPDHHGQNPLR